MSRPEYMELLAPAGSREALVAAVQNGADAVYFGTGGFNARRNAKNIAPEELADAVAYCHLRGVKVYVTLNILISDREIDRACEAVAQISAAGADAVIVQDLGMAGLIRQIAPDLPIHASTQMSVHDLDGVLAAAELGFERVVLARELPAADIAEICRKSPIGIEVFAHGALCMSVSGQCYMSAVIGRRSGNRGLCAQPCRMKYEFFGREGYPLSLKDLNLSRQLQTMQRMGVSSLKIEGRMRRPEYVALVTGIYSRLLREGRMPTPQEQADLERIFSRDGFTEGYFADRTGRSMFGTRTQEDNQESFLAQIRSSYVNTERVGVPVQMDFTADRVNGTVLAARDADGFSAVAQGPAPEAAQRRDTTAADVERNLIKTGGTVFSVSECNVDVPEGIYIQASAINELRRSVLEQLTVQRSTPPERRLLETPPMPVQTAPAPSQELTISVLKLGQISRTMLASEPARIYVPLEELDANPEELQQLTGSGAPIWAIYPRVVTDGERRKALRMLAGAGQRGIVGVLCGNIGHARTLFDAGYRVAGDFGMNVYNSLSLDALAQQGFDSATLSFELRLSQIRDMTKNIDTELIAYGRLPLMVFRNCIVKANSGECRCSEHPELRDRTGQRFPVVHEFGCRNQLLNALPLWLADRREDLQLLGVRYLRLVFTTETAQQCADVISAYTRGENVSCPEGEQGFTRGLYYRGTE